MADNKVQHILMVIPELITGGAQRSFSNLSLELAKHYQVWIVVFNSNDTVRYEVGGEVISLQVDRADNWFSKLWAFVKRIRKLREIKRRLSVDVTISFLEGADYVNILSSVGDRLIISVRGSKYYDREIKGLLGWVRKNVLMPYLYRKADSIVCVSKGIREELISKMGLPSNRIKTIYNFIDPEVSDATPSQPQPGLTEPFLLAVGRLHGQKNFHGLLDVFAEVIKSAPSLKLVILGEGPEEEAIVNHASSLGLRVAHEISSNTQGQQVFLPGFKNPESFFRSSKMFILSSSWEGFPNAILEAMAAGTPVLASNCHTGPAEILLGSKQINVYPCFGDFGILLPVISGPSDSKLWSDTILQLMKEEPVLEKYGKAGRCRVLDFSPEIALKQWITEIENQKSE